MNFTALVLMAMMGAFAQADYTTVGEAAKSVAAFGQKLERQHDRRSLFANVYAETLAATEVALKQGKFKNPAWVSSLVVNYANIYHRTIVNELNGKRASTPLAWQVEFNYIANTHAWTPQDSDGALWSAALDLVYGIHVHIARDLVEALLVTPTQFSSASQHQDFLYITQVLSDAMPVIWNIYMRYEQQLTLGPAIEEPAMMAWIAKMRAQTWFDAAKANSATAAGKKSYLNQVDAYVAEQSLDQGIFLAL